MKVRQLKRRRQKHAHLDKRRGRNSRMSELLRRATGSPRYTMSSIEEQMLTSITTSGRFMLEAAVEMYADVQRRRSTPTG